MTVTAELEALRRLEQLMLAKRERERAAARKYLHDAERWARDCIIWPPGQGLAPYQAETMRALSERRRIAKRGPHGLGKSTEMALLVLWFATTREAAGIDWKVVTTASVWRQLTQYLWPEIHKWARRLNWPALGREAFNERYELQTLQLKLRIGAAFAAASNDPAKIEGAHADHILYILDEAKIIPPETWDAIEGALSNAGPDTEYEAYVVAMSTPGVPAGRFYDIHMRRPGYEDWWTRHVSLAEAVAAGRISQAWADQRKRQWGEKSALYQGRVLGNFTTDDKNSVIPLSWVEAAVERWHVWNDAGRPPQEGAVWLGVDVGRGGDETVLAKRLGPTITLSASHTPDTMKVVELVQLENCRAIVDVVGVGSGVYDRLRQLKLKPMPYTGGGSTNLRDRSKEFTFVNTRSAAYWHLRELLDPDHAPDVCLPPDDLLLSDLTVPTWGVAPGDKIKVENKEDVVKRLKRSPDRGDAVVMAFFATAGNLPTKTAIPQGSIGRTSLSPLGR